MSQRPLSLHATHTTCFEVARNSAQRPPVLVVRIRRSAAACLRADRDQRVPQPAFLSSPRDLLASNPRAFAQWLDTSRPEPVSAQDKARLLSMLPAEGEVINLDDSVRRKLAGLGGLLQWTDRDSVYEIKAVENPFARIVIYERTAILISETVLTLLDAGNYRPWWPTKSGTNMSMTITSARSRREIVADSRIWNFCAMPSAS